MGIKLIYDNQALKLHIALTKLRKPEYTKLSMLDAFSDFFGIDKANTALITSNISKLHHQIYEIKNFCIGMTFLTKQFEKWSPPINTTFINIHLPSPHKNFIQGYSIEDLFLLENTHDALLDKYNHYKIIDQNIVDEVIKSLHEKLLETLQSNASDKVKLYLQTQLNTLIDNLKNYNLFGLEEVHQTIDSTIGHIVTDKDYQSYAQTTEGKNLFEVLLKITGLLEITESATQSILNIQQLIQIGVGG